MPRHGAPKPSYAHKALLDIDTLLASQRSQAPYLALNSRAEQLILDSALVIWRRESVPGLIRFALDHGTIMDRPASRRYGPRNPGHPGHSGARAQPSHMGKLGCAQHRKSAWT